MDQENQQIILTFEAARRVVEEHAASLKAHGKELVSLLEARNRILAEPVIADRDYPPFHRATRDGYALKASGLSGAPVTLQIIGEIQAGISGESAPVALQPGQAVSIMTGAPVPAGADAVVMLEHASRADDGSVRIETEVQAGSNIVASGSETKRGERLLVPGAELDHAAIALAASVGKVHLLVYRRPRVAVLATGNEVVDIDIPPGANQIRNSNTYSLAAQIADGGGEPVLLPIAPDDPKRIRELIIEGLEADLLLLSGGVSAGKYDFVEPVLAEIGAEFLFNGVKIQPGRPLVFGRMPAKKGPAASPKFFFGLPGNPVSTMVTFQLFVRPVLATLCGGRAEKLIFLKAKLKSDIKIKTGLTRFLPAILSGEFENTEVELVRWQGSGDIAALARANCYLVVPEDRDNLAAGESVSVIQR